VVSMGADARGFKPGFANEVFRGDRHSAENPPIGPLPG
jgi:hypothetical protein